MSDIDMSGVDPLRWQEMRNRVAAIQEFLTELAPDDATRDLYARRLGIGRKHFMALVSAWRRAKIKRPAVLHGATAGKGSRRSKRTGLDPRSQAIALGAIAELGPAASLTDLASVIGSRCAAAGVKGPGRSSIANMRMSARGELPSYGGDGIVAGTVLVRLPVDVGDAIILPRIALEISRSDGCILAHELTFTYDPGAGGHDLANEKAIANVLGRGIDGLALVYVGRAAAAAASLARTARDAPLPIADAERIVRDAVTRHSMKRDRAIRSRPSITPPSNEAPS